jgi:Rrf2 family protein
MTVIFSKKCEYGLQAVLYLAANQTSEAISAEEIAKELEIPKEFVSKILQKLTESGMVASKKGKSGGFYLAKKTSEIKLLHIVEAIDGLALFESCVMGFKNCSPDHPCPVHNKWGKLRTEAYEMLNTETLEELKEKAIDKIRSLKMN